jgi:preprotein translocase subunit YajC
VLASSGSLAVVLAASKNSGGSALSWLFPLILVVGGYLLFIRPARMRQRKAVETRSTIVPGVEVVTTAGLIATVVESDDETVTLEIAPGVHSKFLKQAVARVVVPPSEEQPAQEPDGSHEAIPPQAATDPTTESGDETPPTQS